MCVWRGLAGFDQPMREHPLPTSNLDHHPFPVQSVGGWMTLYLHFPGGVAQSGSVNMPLGRFTWIDGAPLMCQAVFEVQEILQRIQQTTVPPLRQSTFYVRRPTVRKK